MATVRTTAGELRSTGDVGPVKKDRTRAKLGSKLIGGGYDKEMASRKQRQNAVGKDGSIFGKWYKGKRS